MKSRAELDALLDDLEARLPGLLADCKQEDAQECFTKEADVIDAQTSDEDQSHVWSRLQHIQGCNGLIPTDEECADG